MPFALEFPLCLEDFFFKSKRRGECVMALMRSDKKVSECKVSLSYVL